MNQGQKLPRRSAMSSEVNAGAKNYGADEKPGRLKGAVRALMAELPVADNGCSKARNQQSRIQQDVFLESVPGQM